MTLFVCVRKIRSVGGNFHRWKIFSFDDAAIPNTTWRSSVEVVELEVELVVLLTVVEMEEWWLTVVNGVWLQEVEVETSLRV
ncbi:hypothetical protein TSUD_230390 [Trifolium subterraneum]|nr:hypothetical protein TSUD_230390 [Trifolium subterraneum]